MARFDVYTHPDPVERKLIPYLLDVQNSYLDPLSTTVVIPLCKQKMIPNSVRDLNPVLTIQGIEVVLNTAELGPVPSNFLRHPVTNLSSDQPVIQAALDTLFGGY